MVDARNYASGKYVNASRLPTDRHIVAVITAVTEEMMELSKEQKLVLALRSGSGKPWPQKYIPNVTALKHLIATFGPQTDGWTGQSIECWSELTRFGADMVLGIKILALNGRGAAQPALEAQAVPASVPPASIGREQINQAVPLTPYEDGDMPHGAETGSDLDDEIPF